MAENVNEHKVIFSADIADIKEKLQELQKAMQEAGLVSASVGNQMANSMGASLAKVGSSLKSLGTTLSVGVTAPLSLLGVALFNSAAQMEQISVSFEVFTGSAEVAKNMLGELKDQALKSPMQFQDITKGAQTLLGYGLTASQVIPITKMLGDISGGNADKFSRLSLAFGQVNAAGRLMGQETRQMINAGFNPLQAISEKTGESMASLTKRMHDGKISVQEVANAFTYATTEGGRFFGNADRQSQTLQGQFNKLQESVTFALAEIGTSLANNGGLKDFFNSLTNLVNRVKDAFLALSPETQSFILKLGLFLAVAGPVLVVFGSMIGAITSIATVVGALTAAFVGLNVVSGGILIGLGIIVNSLINVGVALEKDINSVKEFRKEVEDTQKSFNSFKLVSITEDIRGLYTQIEKLQNLRTKQFFDPVALKKTDDQIKSLRDQINNLQKINEKNNPIEPFNNTPTGLGKELKPKKEKSEDIEYLRNLNEKLKELRDKNKLAANEIVFFWDTAETKKLKDLKKKYDEELKDYDLYSEDYTNITLKYESERQAILRGSKVGGLDARERARRDIMSGGLTQLMNDDFAKQVGTYNKTWQSLVAGDKANSLAEFATSTYAALKDFGMNLSVGFAEVAGAAFSGGISVSEAFTQLKNVFLNSIGDLLIQVGSAAIKLGLFKDGIEAALIAGGISGGPAIAIGLAAIAAGTAIKSFASQDAKKSSVVAPSGMGTSPSVSSKASGSTYAYGGSSYSTQSMKLSIDLTGSITATQTGYAINKSLETTLRVTGR
jgi:tape measure domain-containing protein